MFGSEVVEVGIGVAVLFFFMSLIATALCESLENIVKSRAKYLETGISEIFRDLPGFVETFYKHPLISSLYSGDYKTQSRVLPSYIPRQSFSLALLDLMSVSKDGLAIGTLKTSLQDNPKPNPVQALLLSVINTAGGDIDRTRKILEDWYDGTMDRVSGWYKRRTGYILAAIGLLAAISFNVDAITVAQGLIRDKALRAAVVRQAEPITAPGGQATIQGKSLEQLDRDFKDIGYPIGWTFQNQTLYASPQSCQLKPVLAGESMLICDNSTYGILKAVPGWIITALAIMLGAPFWFDVLNKLMVIRSTVKPNEKSPDESSEDRQGTSSGQSSSPPRQMPATTPILREPPSSTLEPKTELPKLDNVAADMIASEMALAGKVFQPHEWADDASDPQRGLL